MNIIISRSDILSHGPFAEDLKWFDDMVGMQGREDSLLIPGHLGLLWLYCNPECRKFATWVRNSGILPSFNGVGLDLRSLDLRRANLSRADLSRADLERANLYRANLYRANLDRAYLRGATLFETTLEWADLEDADLGEADLERANLYRANLQWTNLRGTNLEGANLFKANLFESDLEGARRSAIDPLIPGWKVVNGLLVKE